MSQTFTSEEVDKLRHEFKALKAERDQLLREIGELRLLYRNAIAGCDELRAALDEISKLAQTRYDNYEEHGGLIAAFEPLFDVRRIARRALSGAEGRTA